MSKAFAFRTVQKKERKKKTNIWLIFILRSPKGFPFEFYFCFFLLSFSNLHHICISICVLYNNVCSRVSVCWCISYIIIGKERILQSFKFHYDIKWKSLLNFSICDMLLCVFLFCFFYFTFYSSVVSLCIYFSVFCVLYNLILNICRWHYRNMVVYLCIYHVHSSDIPIAVAFGETLQQQQHSTHNTE